MLQHAPRLALVVCVHDAVSQSQLTSQMLEKEAMYSACFCTSRELRGPRSGGVSACRVAMCCCPPSKRHTRQQGSRVKGF